MRHEILVTIVIILIVAGAAYVALQPQAKETVKIGVVLPLTGKGTIDQGQASQHAVTLAIEQINRDGGLLGKKVEAVFENSQCEPSIGVTAIRKLIDIDKANFIIGDICDSVTAAIIPVAEKSKKVLITPGSTSPDISNAGDYIFRFWFSENDLGGMITDKAYEMGYRKMAIIYIDNAWGEAQKNAVSAKFTSNGGEIVGMEKIGNTADFRTILSKLEEKNPDSYYIGVHPFGLASIMKQIKEFNITKQVFSHGGLVGSTQVLGLDEDGILEGIMAPFVYDPSSSFRNMFVTRFGTEPGITADSSYDAVMVASKIIKGTEKSDSDTIKDGLYKIQNYTGASGIIAVDGNGDTQRQLRLMIVRGNMLVPYE